MNDPVYAPAHVEAAKPVLTLLIVVNGILALVLLSGGVFLAFTDKFASTTLRLFGNDFSSTSVGVSIAFIGAVVAVLVCRRILKSLDHLAALPE